ncbi:hypothetical protein O7983_000762 [Mycoplasmopsis felis]|uniref:Vmc-like lipoprotein signal peptide domain-containing protein n=1 Tax=Mycoplasmopsis felis TaxID=33923 RepID=UPI003A4D80E2
MKKIKKIILSLGLVSSIASVASVVSCKDDKEPGTTKKPEPEKVETPEERELKQLRSELNEILGKITEKGDYAQQIENGDKNNLSLLKLVLQNLLTSEISKEKTTWLETIKNAFDESSLVKTELITKLSLASNKEVISEVIQEFHNHFNQLKTNITEEWLNKINNKDELVQEMNSLEENEVKFSEFVQKVINKYDEEKQPELEDKKTSINQKIQALKLDEKGKKELTDKVSEITKYSELINFETKELEAIIQREKLDEQREFESKKLEIETYLTLLTTEEIGDKDFASKLTSIQNSTEADSLLTEVKNAYGSTSTQEKISKVKELINQEVEKLTTTEGNKIKKKVTDNSTLEQLLTIFTEARAKYQEEFKKDRDLTLTNEKTLRSYEPNSNYDFISQIDAAKTKEELKTIRDEIVRLIRTHKPRLFETENAYTRNTPYSATRVPSDAPAVLPDGAYRVNTITTTRNNNYIAIYSSTPQMVRTYKLNEEEQTIRENLIALKNRILKEFYDETPTNGSKTYTFKVAFQNNRAREISASKLLYSIDRALIDGYFYQEVYDKYLGKEEDGKTFGATPYHSFWYLKNTTLGNTTNSNI